jgi:hypothetical protein
MSEDDRQWIASQLGAFETRLDAKLETLETKLLRAFHNWASPVEMRARSHSAALRALDIDIEVESLGDRVSKLEPPQ